MLGTEFQDAGTIFQSDSGLVVKKQLTVNEKIPVHNHPGADVFFTLVKGKAQVFIGPDDTTYKDEEFTMTPGKTLHFEGENFIHANILEDAEIFVFLLNK